MEIFRALAALIEPPSPALAPVARALDLGELPPDEVHTDLFAFQLYPFASVYLSEDGMLGGTARDRVAGFWRALGADVPAEADHLAVLLAGYASLREQAEGAMAPGDALTTSPASRQAQHACTAFLGEHLSSWLPAWLRALDRLTATRPARAFYRAWGELLGQALEEAMGVSSQTDPLPLHLRAAPPLAHPSEEGADAFLKGLLAPAVSGLILVREDLARCARESELGLRMGERAFVLRSLISQEPTSVLHWLAVEARRQAPHSRAQGVVNDYWRDRAMATCQLVSTLAEEAETRGQDGPTTAVDSPPSES